MQTAFKLTLSKPRGLAARICWKRDVSQAIVVSADVLLTSIWTAELMAMRYLSHKKQ
jgi:hypothetical protein